MICSHSSPLNEISVKVSNLETESLDLSTILHAKDASQESNQNRNNFERRQPANIPVLSICFEETVKSEATNMNRPKKTLQSQNEVSCKTNKANRNRSSDKENVHHVSFKSKQEKLNGKNNEIIEKPPDNINGSSYLEEQLNECYLTKHSNVSLQEFSLFNDFSPSVRAMLTELGLKPSSKSVSAMESRSKISSFDLSDDIPKPLPLRENKILMNKLEQVGSFVPSIFKSVNSEQEYKSTDYYHINQMEKDLEKERFRRKHYERVIEDLQQKVLTVEQELALVSSLNERKNLTIKELQQTLENLAIAWQKLEGSQMKVLKETEIERDNLKIQLEASLNQIISLQKDLQETKEKFSDQKIKSAKEHEQHEEVVKNLTNQKLKLEEELAASKESYQRELMFVEDLKKEILKLQKQLQEEQMSLLQKESGFDNFKHVIQNQLSEEVKRREEKETKLKETTHKLETSLAEIMSLKETLCVEKEKKDIIEAELRNKESEYINGEIKYRTEMACKVKEVQVRSEEQSKHLEEMLKKKHQEEISRLLFEHKQWKEEETARHLKEIQECKNEIAKKCEESQEWLETSETEVLDLRHKIEQFERGRSQMLSQLRSFLQSMWRNSFQLFYGSCDPDEENQFDEYISMPAIPNQAEFYSVPTSRRKYFSTSLPLNLTSSFEFSHQHKYRAKKISDAEAMETKQYDISLNKKHLGTSVTSSKYNEKYFSNGDSAVWQKEQPSLHDYMNEVICESRTKLQPADSQVHVEENYSVFPEHISSVDCQDYSTCFQVRNDCDKLKDKVSLCPNISYPSSSASNDMIIDCCPNQKVKNSVHFMIPCKDSDKYSGYSEEENRPCNDEYSVKSNSSSEMMGLPPLNPKQSSFMIQKVPAEKLGEYSKPVKKEVIIMNPVLNIQSGIVSDKIEKEIQKENAQNEPAVLQRKTYSSEKLEHFKNRKAAKMELPSNYSIKDIRSIYCPETRYDVDKGSLFNSKDLELNKKLHPWK